MRKSKSLHRRCCCLHPFACEQPTYLRTHLRTHMLMHPPISCDTFGYTHTQPPPTPIHSLSLSLSQITSPTIAHFYTQSNWNMLYLPLSIYLLNNISNLSLPPSCTFMTKRQTGSIRMRVGALVRSFAEID